MSNANEGTLSVQDAANKCRITFEHAWWNIENGYWEIRRVRHNWWDKNGRIRTMTVIRVIEESVKDWIGYVAKLPNMNSRANKNRTEAACAEFRKAHAGNIAA